MTILYYLQHQGLARRTIISMLKENVITINDEIISDSSYIVKKNDLIVIIEKSGKIKTFVVEPIRERKEEFLLVNKPKGCVVSKKDPHNPTIYELLPAGYETQRYYIGRLDKESHGLVLFTNHPATVDAFENPKSDIAKRYIVVIDKPFGPKEKKASLTGKRVDEHGSFMEDDPRPGREFLRFKNVHYEQHNGRNILLIVLTEGKKRHIRRMLKALSYRVIDLQRIAVGPYELGTLGLGKWKKVPAMKNMQASD